MRVTHIHFKMHFNLQSFLSLTLAVSTLFAGDAVARPHQHSARAHSGFHQPKYAKRFGRTGPAKRDSLSSLQDEVKSFEGFMSGFVKGGSTSPDSVGQLQSQVESHVQAVHSFVSDAGDSADGRSTSVLQSDVDAFKAWIDNWAKDVSYASSTDALNQLSSELTSYEGWLNAWIGISGPSTESAPASGADGTTTVQQTSTATVVTTQTMTGTPPQQTTFSVVPSPSQAPSPSSAAPSSSTPEAAPSHAVPSPKPVPSPSSAAPSPSSAPSGGSGGSSSGSPMLAGWWGQTAAASQYNLGDICKDPNYDIVMLSFLNNFFSAGGMPTLNLGPSTGQPSQSQEAAGATGLFNGEDLAGDIQACQSSGKKVMLTLGGAAGYSQSQFASDGQAEQFAGTIWDLFLGGDSPLRPFQDIKLDGIDVDNENKDQTGYTAFVSALRQKFGEDSSKDYFISGAPQCPQPDESIPMDAMRQMDYVS